MKLYAKEKLMSLHNRYFIYNEFEEIQYEIESKAISVGAKTTVYDKYHNTVAYIEEEVLHLMPHYNVYINNALQYHIKKKFHFCNNDYELSNNYNVEGSTFNMNFSILNNQGKLIATVERALFSLGDKYEINILDENDITTILTIIVAITNDIDRAQASSSN